MKKLLLFVLLIVLPLSADFKRTSGLIDIPTTRILPHFGFRIGGDLTIKFGTGTYDQVVEENIHASLGLGNFLELYFDFYTIIENWTWGTGFCHRLYGSDKFGLAWGVHGFSDIDDISEIERGDSTGWHDDLLYEQGDYLKPYERFSGFVVSTYALNKDIDVSLGVGRGRYVGYGQKSKYFNSNFYHEQGGDWGVGLFGGVEFKLSKETSFMIDADGRDINAGFVYQPLPWEFGIAVTKIEYFFDWDEYRPRLALSASYKRIPKEPGPGVIAGTVYDTEGDPLVAAVTIPLLEIPVAMTEPEFGSYEFAEIEPNLYEVTASAEGYSKEKKKVEALADDTVYCDFVLRMLPGDIIGKVIDGITEEPLVAGLTLVQTTATTESDAEGVFGFAELEPDVYTVGAEASGYMSATVSAEVLAGEETEVLIKLMQIVFSLEGVNFDFDKATLRPESYPILDSAGTTLKNYGDMRVEIQGHTCWLGSDEYNLNLSDRRASSVMKYMVTEQMIAPDRLVAKGYGESSPAVSNETREGRERNRRWDFVIIE
jgi:outer membrane protein OmpA-like peptidoglycan-associated protein